MNERIKQLAEQAGAVFEPTNGLNDCPQDSLVDDEIQKFAELIVRECLSIVDDAERGGSNEVWDNAVKFIRKDLKEHFGVEE